ncbi:hypothetical protein Bbelb_354310 [Branchiostoma belcheri]|nr:hypothetical protein Bbelb_354310 [Branchiostoma belcheri]
MRPVLSRSYTVVLRETFPTLRPEEVQHSVLTMKALVILFLGLIVCAQAMEISRAKRRVVGCSRPVLCYVDPCMTADCPGECRPTCDCRAECGSGGGGGLFRRLLD